MVEGPAVELFMMGLGISGVFAFGHSILMVLCL